MKLTQGEPSGIRSTVIRGRNRITTSATPFQRRRNGRYPSGISLVRAGSSVQTAQVASITP